MKEQAYKSSILQMHNFYTSLNNVSNINQSYPTVYNRNYLILKSQYTVLENLQPRIEKPPRSMTWEDKQKLSYIGSLIESLKETKFGNLFQTADNTITSIRNILNSSKLHPENEKLLNTLLNAVLTINQICNTLNALYSAPSTSDYYDNYDNSDYCSPSQFNVPINPPSPDQVHRNSDNFDNELLVCRICDEKIPASLFEEHTESCLTRYRSESKIKDINEQIQKLQISLKDQYLNVPWPGQPKRAVEVLFPIIHFMIILDRAKDLDPHISDTIDELSFIQSVMISFQASNLMSNITSIKLKIKNQNEISLANSSSNMSLSNTPSTSSSNKKENDVNISTSPTANQYISRASVLINEKIRTSNALNDALIVSRQTRASHNQIYDKNFKNDNDNNDDDKHFQKKTTIADFNFIKRISKGAYASVFLATKKSTGDIFAIKVTPKSSLKQKNQVRRILIEKDILLQFSNPFIVTFCMYFFQ